MTDPHLPTRRFSENETDAILRRAAELQATGGAGQNRSRGLTVSEMERLAGEAGLDPTLIRQAASEVEVRTAARASPLIGVPTRLMFERAVQGEMDDDAWEATVLEAQRLCGQVGQASQVGRTRSWTMLGGMGQAGTRAVSLSATVQNGRTIIRVDESLKQLAGALFGGLIGGLGGGTISLTIGIGRGVYHSPAVAATLALSMFGVSYTLARSFLARSARRRAAELAMILDTAERAVLKRDHDTT
jgi:hypothetical protein